MLQSVRVAAHDGFDRVVFEFEGEQHGFRQAANIRRALDAELSFYAQVFGFELPAAEGIEPVEVDNL